MNDVVPLIGLIGKKRTGKDTFAAVLTEVAGYQRVAFADPLKEAALFLDPIIDEDGIRLAEVVHVAGWERAKEVPEVRRTLQFLGRAIRAIDPDFWLNAAFAKIDATDGPVVITDVRFPNEADAIRDAGGLLIRITRPGTGDGDQDPSETALDDYDREHLVVVNEGTVENLQRVARSIAERTPRLFN